MFKYYDKTPEEWEQAVRQMVEKTIPEGEKGKLNAMLAPEFIGCDLRQMSLTLGYHNQPWMCNPVGNMHGGMISTAFDITMGVLCIGACGFEAMTPTVSMQVSYLRSVPSGERLFIEARVDHLGKTLVQVTARGWLPSSPEQPAATACATYYIAKSTEKSE